MESNATILDRMEAARESIVFRASQDSITDQALDLVTTVVHIYVCTILSYGGIVTNIMVIAVFAKQRFKDGVSVSMTAIAFWDLVKCIVGVLQRLNWPISIFSPSFAFTWEQATFVLAYLHIFIGYVSSVLAAYVSLERCLCVTIPFKVKSIFTPRLTFNIMVVLSVLVLGSFLVVYSVWDVVYIFSPDYNAIVAMFQYNDFYHKHGALIFSYYNVISTIYPILSFIIILVSTLITVFFLQKASEFRCKNASIDSRNQGISSRDRQVVKMLVVVIVVYIVNLFPRVVLSLVRFSIPEFYLQRKHHNVYMVTSILIFVLDFANASTNLFIFLSMSSNFRSTFEEVVPCCRRGIEKGKNRHKRPKDRKLL